LERLEEHQPPPNLAWGTKPPRRDRIYTKVKKTGKNIKKKREERREPPHRLHQEKRYQEREDTR
jgi:hypothetical protein